MTVEPEELRETLKRQKLRNNEYYDMQPIYDSLYESSKKSFKFKDLLKHITDERNITLAYRNIKRNKGSNTRGSDDITIERWENSTNKEYIEYVRKRLENYKPQSVRRVYIPKANGKLRPLGIPTIGDRLIQQCIKQVLEPICEAKFHNHSYGFRPNRSTKHAIAKVYHSVNIVNLYHVVDVDIKGFFDNVNHSKLLKQLWSLGIRDKNLLCIISKMLKAEIEGEGIPNKGVPQGGILSPLLSNIVLNEFDWWVSDQWETFETRHQYYTDGGTSQSKKYRALRNSSKLKEMLIVRYADDFKIMCRSKSDAKKTFLACKEWLHKRLGLEVSEEKSSITDIRKKNTEFLGLSIGVQPKRNVKENRIKHEYVIESHMSPKAQKQCVEKLKEHIKRIRREPTAENVLKYNSAVLGIQNYYKCATHVNNDLNKLAFTVNRILYNRLRTLWSNKGSPSATYKRLYKNNYRIRYMANVALYPLGDIRHQKVMLFSQSICNYNIEGRQQIHKKLSKYYDLATLHYLMENPLRDVSIELNDNRLSLYIGQYGKCGVTKRVLHIGDIEVHHKKPRSIGGSDKYNNLIIVCKDVHKLIHAQTQETIEKYKTRLNLDLDALTKINDLRLLAGNNKIA